MIRLLTLALASTLFFMTGCIKKAESFLPSLPAIGTRGMILESMLRPTLDAVDVFTDNTASSHLCQVSTGTPVHSVHNAKDRRVVHVILEEDSPEDLAYVRLIHSTFELCTKGTVVALDASMFTEAINHLNEVSMQQKK